MKKNILKYLIGLLIFLFGISIYEKFQINLLFDSFSELTYLLFLIIISFYFFDQKIFSEKFIFLKNFFHIKKFPKISEKSLKISLNIFLNFLFLLNLFLYIFKIFNLYLLIVPLLFLIILDYTFRKKYFITPSKNIFLLILGVVTIFIFKKYLVTGIFSILFSIFFFLSILFIGDFIFFKKYFYYSFFGDEKGQFKNDFSFYLKRYFILGIAFTFIYQGYGFISKEIKNNEHQILVQNSKPKKTSSEAPKKVEEKFSYFSDLPDSNWAYLPLKFTEENGYFFVDENENIYPEKGVTFMETLKIFNLIYNVGSNELAKRKDVKFKFVKKEDNDYYAMKYGYYSGLIGKEFDPYQVITKKYLLTFFGITLGWDYDKLEGNIFDKNFEVAKEKGIIGEYSEGDYDSKINRAVFSAIVYRIFNQQN